jgi:NadR type nicotinamide-nucleotide adenylyltransferase
MVKKIVVIGPESTGKSTLSEALAKELHTVWVPEYARTYLERLDRPYEEADMLPIAQGQLMTEDEAAAQARRLLVCDTDLYVLKVWSEHSFNRCHPFIMEQIATRPYDLYLLTDIDLAWTPDPLREHPLPEMRYYFYHQYRDIVQHSGVPWINISGPHEVRLAAALEAIAAICKC